MEVIGQANMCRKKERRKSKRNKDLNRGKNMGGGD